MNAVMSTHLVDVNTLLSSDHLPVDDYSSTKLRLVM